MSQTPQNFTKKSKQPKQAIFIRPLRVEIVVTTFKEPLLFSGVTDAHQANLSGSSAFSSSPQPPLLQWLYDLVVEDGYWLQIYSMDPTPNGEAFQKLQRERDLLPVENGARRRFRLAR